MGTIGLFNFGCDLVVLVFAHITLIVIALLLASTPLANITKVIVFEIEVR